MVGRAAGRKLHALAHNRDPRRVQPRRRRRSVGAQRAFGRRPWSPEFLDAALVGLVDRVSRRMRRAGRRGRTVVLRMRFTDFSRATRSHTLSRPTDETAVLLAAARELLAAAMPMLELRGITMIGIAVTNLDVGDVQLSLLESEATVALDAAVDAVRARYGTSAITRAVLLGRDQGFTVPMLPD